MNDYRYDDVVDVVAGAKRGLGSDAPVHLFGAGHPMMFALGVAMGCDLFDSAAYALYARDDRYLTVSGTHHLEDLDYLPVRVPSVRSTRRRNSGRSTTSAARRNSPPTTSTSPSRRFAGSSRRSVPETYWNSSRRARAHPTMLDGYRTLLDHADQLERSDPVSKGSFSTSPTRAPADPKWCATIADSSASPSRTRCF